MDNTSHTCTCGSGKKYKQCCGKQHKIRKKLNLIKLIIGSSFITCPQDIDKTKKNKDVDNIYNVDILFSTINDIMIFVRKRNNLYEYRFET